MEKETTDDLEGVRIYMKESDFRALVEKLDEIDWDHDARWRLKLKWSKHLSKRQQAERREEVPIAAFVTGFGPPKRGRRKRS